jgi:glycosyltransferase involved in cell wall biosynthesis
VEIEYEPQINNINFWKNYQIVHFHRTLGQNYDTSADLIKMLNQVGVKTIMDLDDYWLPTPDHPIHALVFQNKIHEKIIANLKASNYVTTTTSLFANEISKFNKNTFIFPNAIDPNENQFKQNSTPSDRLRFGWLGGSSHLHDILILESLFSRMDEFKNQTQAFLCGFDIRGTVTEIDKASGKETRRDIKPHETVWSQYESIFTNNYKLISESYRNFLHKYKNEENLEFDNEFYNRVWTKPINSYAVNYSKFDISLAPIKNHIFNRMKSQLKIIEAGFFKKAIIASNLGPYTIDTKHAMNKGNFTDGNALLVDENRNHSDWFYYAKKLIQNPNFVQDLGERLYETVHEKYNLEKVTKDRAEFYKSIL